MNKTLLVLIIGIIVVGGAIGYVTLSESKDDATHTPGDGHTEAQHEEMMPHDDTGTAPHGNEVAPHDDAGLAPHQD